MNLGLKNRSDETVLEVPEGNHSIGREDKNPLIVDDTSVSRQHASLRVSEEGFFVEDLGSTNGTKLHGSLVQERTQVHIGDVIFFGNVEFELVELEASKFDDLSEGLREVSHQHHLIRKPTDLIRLDGIRLKKPDSVPKVAYETGPKPKPKSVQAPLESQPLRGVRTETAPTPDQAAKPAPPAPVLSEEADLPLPTIPTKPETASPAVPAPSGALRRDSNPLPIWLTLLFAIGFGFALGLLTALYAFPMR